ncbi:unnamed protein product [Boreogadus saida]
MRRRDYGLAPVHPGTPHHETDRQPERLYKRTRLTVHAEAYERHISSYRDALQAAKSAHFSTLINGTNRNPRILFSTSTNSSIRRTSIHPPHLTSITLSSSPLTMKSPQ